MSMIRLVAAAVLAASLVPPAAAQGIPKAQSPEEVGFVATRLKRLSDRIEEGVKNNELPGAVVLIARNGKLVMFDSFGFRDKDAKVPMTNDTIFRIASMTKPIVSVAAIMLMEEGKLTLADPVSRYIPAFADTKVAVEKKNDDGTVEYVQEPQTRPMTVQDLLRHTSGLTYGAVGANTVQAVLPRPEGERPQPDQRRDGRQARQAVAGLPARHDLGIFHVDRRAGPRRRGRLGHAARQVHRGAHHQAAEDGRHRLRGRRRQEGRAAPSR